MGDIIPGVTARFISFADRTRLELATSAVTGQHSNQLNYRSFGVPSRFRTLDPLVNSEMYYRCAKETFYFFIKNPIEIIDLGLFAITTSEP